MFWRLTLRSLDVSVAEISPGFWNTNVGVNFLNSSMQINCSACVLKIMTSMVNIYTVVLDESVIKKFWLINPTQPHVLLHELKWRIFRLKRTMYLGLDSLLARSLSIWCLVFLFTPSWWFTCSRVLFILSWQDFMLSTSLMRLFSTPSLTKSIPFLPSLI